MPLQVKADILHFNKDELKKGYVPSLRTCVRFAKDHEAKRNIQQQVYEKNESSPFFKRLSTTQKDITHFIGGRASVELLEQLIHQSSSTQSSKQVDQTPLKMRRKTKDQRIRQQLDLEVDL